jgi:hypothetical protein
MIKFLSSKIVQAFPHKDKTQILKYIPLIYGVGSTLNKIEDLTERKKIAAEQCEIEVPENTEDLRKVIIEFLRLQHHNKFALLISKEELLIECLDVLREPLVNSKDDDKRLKNVKLKGDVNALCDKLVVETDLLRIDIFTEEHAEESKKVISIEERLKAKG